MDYRLPLQAMMLYAGEMQDVPAYASDLADTIARLAAGFDDPEERKLVLDKTIAGIRKMADYYRLQIENGVGDEGCNDPNCPVHGGTRH